MSIWRAAIIAIAALGALSACRADIAVHVEVAPDGGGTVTASVAFDAEVMAYIPDLDQILRLDDVMATGWVIDQSRLDGGLVITLTKSFASKTSWPWCSQNSMVQTASSVGRSWRLAATGP